MTVPPRYEIVRTADNMWHGRYRASNGEIFSTSESYKSKRAAERWVELNGNAYKWEVRDIDERPDQ